MASPLGHTIRDIRMHDLRQAGAISRRLGGGDAIGDQTQGSRRSGRLSSGNGNASFASVQENSPGSPVMPHKPPGRVQKEAEQTVQRVESQHVDSETRTPAVQELDIEAIADRVYRMMKRDLLIDKERQGRWGFV